MEENDLNSIILSFFRDDVGAILITNEAGEVLYEDQLTSFVRREKTNWEAACPPPREGQRGVIWDLLNSENKQTYMVITSSFRDEEGIKQIHHMVNTNTSLYMDMYRNISEYSKDLRTKKEYDDLTGL